MSTRDSLLTTHYVLLTTYYSLLTTYYSLLTLFGSPSYDVWPASRVVRGLDAVFERRDQSLIHCLVGL